MSSAATQATAPSARGAGLSVVIPAYNEEASVRAVLDETQAMLNRLGVAHEIIVVDDCSRDQTGAIAESAGVTVLRNVENGGYGYSLMRGIRHAQFPAIAIVDADGSYPINALPQLFEEYRRGVAMIVGQRQGEHYARSVRIRFVRWLFKSLTEFIVGRAVPDVNSGMRIFERDAVLPLLPYMSSGFSFTTSITLLFMMRALPVSYVPVEYRKREGTSKVNYFRDALRALQIIASVTVRLNPIKLFLMGAVLNLALLIPVVILSWGATRLALVVTLVVECSVLLVGLGLVVESLVDKLQFSRVAPTERRDPDRGWKP
ncbi:MAG: glycosyltransferase family 2 protein [Candidatus Binatia bacterium]